MSYPQSCAGGCLPSAQLFVYLLGYCVTIAGDDAHDSVLGIPGGHM